MAPRHRADSDDFSAPVMNQVQAGQMQDHFGAVTAPATSHAGHDLTCRGVHDGASVGDLCTSHDGIVVEEAGRPVGVGQVTECDGAKLVKGSFGTPCPIKVKFHNTGCRCRRANTSQIRHHALSGEMPSILAHTFDKF